MGWFMTIFVSSLAVWAIIMAVLISKIEISWFLF